MVPSLGYNDWILLVSLIYSSIDLQYEWDSFSSCSRPIHQWLLVSYASVIIFRLTHLLGVRSANAGAGEFLLDLRQKGTLPRILASFTWLVALPFFVIITGVGTVWLVDTMMHTPNCVPTGTHLWFTILWLALSYIWVVIHVALGVMAMVLERRVRRAEVNLHELEDADMIARWGQVSQLDGYRSLSGQNAGLTPSEIGELSSASVMELMPGDEEQECPICLITLQQGESVRQLGTCGHTFHKACIDLWLIRRADCPLCKRCVKVGGNEA